MEQLVLKDKDLFPESEVLKAVLNDSFQAYQELNEKLVSIGIQPEWRYYNDGKAWLCKLNFKKKNMGWLHVYNGHFKITFYFTEKHIEAIGALEIAESTKKEFFQTKAVGKLLPMIFTVTDTSCLKDVLTTLLFKKSLK